MGIGVSEARTPLRRGRVSVLSGGDRATSAAEDGGDAFAFGGGQRRRLGDERSDVCRPLGLGISRRASTPPGGGVGWHGYALRTAVGWGAADGRRIAAM